MRFQNVPGKARAVDLHGTEGEQESEEVAVVSGSETIVHPGTVMVAFRYAVVAETAVFGSSGFGEFAGGAGVVGLEEDVVVRVFVDLGGVVGGCDVVGFVGDCEVGEDVGWEEKEWDWSYEVGGEEVEGIVEEEDGAAG